jgi:hypothetical protein
LLTCEQCGNWFEAGHWSSPCRGAVLLHQLPGSIPQRQTAGKRHSSGGANVGPQAEMEDREGRGPRSLDRQLQRSGPRRELKPRIETLPRKKEADEPYAQVKVDVSRGVHTPLSRSVTVATAAGDWLAYVEMEGIEKATLANYRYIVSRDLIPRIGSEKLAKLTTPRVNAFRTNGYGRPAPGPWRARFFVA